MVSNCSGERTQWSKDSSCQKCFCCRARIDFARCDVTPLMPLVIRDSGAFGEIRIWTWLGMTTKEWREYWWRVDSPLRSVSIMWVAMIGSLNQRGPVVALSRAASRILKRMPGGVLVVAQTLLAVRAWRTIEAGREL